MRTRALVKMMAKSQVPCLNTAFSTGTAIALPLLQNATQTTSLNKPLTLTTNTLNYFVSAKKNYIGSF